MSTRRYKLDNPMEVKRTSNKQFQFQLTQTASETQPEKTNIMSKKSVFCIVPSLLQADQIVDCLQDEGFSSNDVSALLPDQTGTRDFAHRKGTKVHTDNAEEVKRVKKIFTQAGGQDIAAAGEAHVSTPRPTASSYPNPLAH